jgi:fibronectin-binding autotransporter adhesin
VIRAPIPFITLDSAEKIARDMRAMLRRRHRLARTAACALFTLAGISGAARAAEWSGGGPGNNWSTAGNWLGGVAPANDGTVAVVFALPAPAGSLVDVPWSINRLDMTGSVGLTGTTITFGGAAPQIVLAGVHSIANPLEFLSNMTLVNDNDLLLAGGLSGFASFTKSGPGRLTIATPSLYAGTTTIASGTLQLGDGIVHPATISAPIVNHGELVFLAGGPMSIPGVSGTGNVTFQGGTVTSAGPLVHAGSTHVADFGWVLGQFSGGGPLTLLGRLETGDSAFASLAGTGQLSILFGGTLTVGSDDTSTAFTGPITGAGSLTKVGNGRLTLAGPSLHSATTRVAAGTLRIGDGVAAPPAILGPIVNDAALEFFPAANIGIAGLTGSGTLAVLGGSVASGLNPLAHSGATTVSAGAFLGGSFPDGGPLTIAAGGQVDSVEAVIASLSGGGQFNFGTLTVGGGNTDTTFTGPLTGGVLRKVGTGLLVLGSPAVHGGTTLVTAGTLRFGDGASAPGPIFAPIIVDGALEFHATTGTTLSGSVSGPGSVRVLGGSVTGNAPFAHGGPTVVDGGALRGAFQGNGSLAIAAAGRVDALSGVFTSLAGAGTLDIIGNVAVGLGGASSTFTGPIGGVGPVAKLGTGTVMLTGPIATAGGVEHVEGTLVVNGPVAGPMTVVAGANLVPGLGAITLATGSLALSGSMPFEILGAAPGSQYDQVVVTGTVTLAGAPLVLEGTYVPVGGNAFTLIANDGVDPVSGTFAGLAEGSTRVFNGTTLRISYVGGTGNDVVLTAIPAAATFDWSGQGGDAAWSTPGNWVGGFAPPSASTTAVTFGAAGTTFAPSTDAPWIVNRIDIGGSAPYALGGAAIAFAGAAPRLEASGGVHNLANDLVLPATLAIANAQNLSLGGAISGPGGLAKAGAGRVTLAGASTFAGGMVVNAGTVLVTGAIPGPVTVNVGATLGGTGTVGGSVAIGAGGALAPGTSPGVINTGDLVIAGVLQVEIEGTAPGSGYDVTNVTGTVAIAGGTLQLLGAYVPVAGDSFTILANDAADPVAGTFAGLAEGATRVFNGTTLRISYVGGTGNDVVLTALAAAAAGPVPVPTLSEWALILLAVLVAGAGARGAGRRPGPLYEEIPVGSRPDPVP